jgi:hypothetical protein
MHFILALVAVPVFWVASTMVIQTYAAYGDIVDIPIETLDSNDLEKDYVSRTAAIINF